MLAEEFGRHHGVLQLGEIGPYEVCEGGGVTLLAGGVGPAAAAAATATVLTATARSGSDAAGSALPAMQADPPYDLVLSAGIAGGFAGRADVGDLVLASELVAADLGADSDDGFLSLDRLGFGTTRLAAAPLALTVDGLRLGPVLTVSTATGTARRADELAARFDATAEAMEGFGVAEAARRYGVPVGELRGISNRVGRRDRDTWDVPAAFAALRRGVAGLATLLQEH